MWIFARAVGESSARVLPLSHPFCSLLCGEFPLNGNVKTTTANLIHHTYPPIRPRATPLFSTLNRCTKEERELVREKLVKGMKRESKNAGRRVIGKWKQLQLMLLIRILSRYKRVTVWINLLNSDIAVILSCRIGVSNSAVTIWGFKEFLFYLINLFKFARINLIFFLAGEYEMYLFF